MDRSSILLECQICSDNTPVSGGVRCGEQATHPSQRHFVCAGCLQRLIVEHDIEPGRLEANGGNFPCPSPGCRSRPWTLEILEPLLDRGTLLAYSKAVRGHAFDAPRARAEAAAGLAARELAVRDARLAMDERVRQLRLLIVERDLTLHCPRCASVFEAYEGCNALNCARCGCGFCAVCLEDCGRDAHAHYNATHGGDIFNRVLFDNEHRLARLARLLGVLRGLAVDGGRPLQVAVIAELARADLEPLGIDPALLYAGIDTAPVPGPAPAVWQCPACTLENAMGDERCGACDGRKPKAAQQMAVARHGAPQYPAAMPRIEAPFADRLQRVQIGAPLRPMPQEMQILPVVHARLHAFHLRATEAPHHQQAFQRAAEAPHHQQAFQHAAEALLRRGAQARAADDNFGDPRDQLLAAERRNYIRHAGGEIQDRRAAADALRRQHEAAAAAEHERAVEAERLKQQREAAEAMRRQQEAAAAAERERVLAAERLQQQRAAAEAARRQQERAVAAAAAAAAEAAAVERRQRQAAVEAALARRQAAASERVRCESTAAIGFGYHDEPESGSEYDDADDEDDEGSEGENSSWLEDQRGRCQRSFKSIAHTVR
jgi:hypothetical protein